MQSISLWDDGISNRTMIVCDDDFPFNEVRLPSDSPPPPVFPGAPVYLITGLPGLPFSGSGSSNSKAKKCSPDP